MDPLVRGVAARFLQAESIGDPKEILREFEQEVRKLEQTIPQGTAEKAKRVQGEMMEAFRSSPKTNRFTPVKFDHIPDYNEIQAYDSKAIFELHRAPARMQDIGHRLFLALLQTYALPVTLRKKVETISRFYFKKPKKPKAPSNTGMFSFWAIDLYESMLSVYLDHVDVAKDAIRKGKEHVEAPAEGGAWTGTKMKVGPFTLVNTGGFPEKTMQEVADIVQKSTALIQSSGLGKVCYGDIQVTNTVHGTSKVAAFYLIASDELFVRANVKANWDTIHTVCHELGHRYHKKFLPGGDRDVERLYRQMSGQEIQRKVNLRDKKPQVGETFATKSGIYRVTGTTWARKGIQVLVELVSDPKVKGNISLEGWAALKGFGGRDVDKDPNFKGFVTDYAKKTPAENFAEMFAFYCMGRLPVLQSVPFEELVFGTEKNAHDRSVQQVAARWIAEA